MESSPELKQPIDQKKIGVYTFDEYVQIATRFHGYPAPGILIGGFMVEEAKSRIPEGILFDAISETSWCLPDSVQILTPCKIGNGWLKIVDFGIYALSLYDKLSGEGVRVYLDINKLDQWQEIKAWYMKLRPKSEQNSDLLREQISLAGSEICSIENIQVHEKYLQKRSKGKLGVCPICGEAYPLKYGDICRSCQGDSPYSRRKGGLQVKSPAFDPPDVSSVPVKEAIGGKLLHDMTKIDPGNSKGAEFKAGQVISIGDVCRLQQMGRNRIFLEPEDYDDPNWLHEDVVAKYFGQAMAGENVCAEGEPNEGKVNLKAEQDGLLLLDRETLNSFNLLPGVMCASKHCYSVVSAGTRIAGTRAIPLYLQRNIFDACLSLLADKPLFDVKPLRKAKVGILITGTEIFKGLIEDKFEDIITRKVKSYGCSVSKSIIVPDESTAVKDGIHDLISSGCDLIVTTAGLSVDPEDLTRQGLIKAGAENMLYGAPVLPGAMTLLAQINHVQIFGVPACALFFKTTSFDLLLPRLLAGIEITRSDLAELGHGAMCHECKNCTFPKCTFGK